MSLNENQSAKKISVTVAVNEPEVGFIDEMETAKPRIDITRGRHRTFVITTSILLFVSHLPYLLVFIAFMVKKEKTNQFLFSFFQQNQDVYWTYAIVACVIYFIILIAPTVFPKVGHGVFGIPLYAMLWICGFYMIIFGFMKQSQGKYGNDSGDILLFFGCAFYNASFGLFITACFSIKRVPKAIGLGVTLVGMLLCLLLLWLFSQTTFKPMWENFLYFLFAAGVSLYYSYDLELMVRKRGSEYSTTDWFNGFIHIQTDITFRIWKDLFFSKPKINEEIVAELSASEPEIQVEESEIK